MSEVQGVTSGNPNMVFRSYYDAGGDPKNFAISSGNGAFVVTSIIEGIDPSGKPRRIAQIGQVDRVDHLIKANITLTQGILANIQ